MHNSRYLVSGCDNSNVLIWDLKNKNIIKTFQVRCFLKVLTVPAATNVQELNIILYTYFNAMCYLGS